jgi:cytochrome P450
LVALQHRDEVNGADQDDVALANVVAETMRLEPSIGYIPRTTVAPVEIYHNVIPAGSIVFLSIAAAGRDESVWSEPDRFEPDRYLRPETPRPLGFGAGTHYCLGRSMAQIALEESMRAVLAEPSLHLAEDAADIPWRQVLGRSPARLLVTS